MKQSMFALLAVALMSAPAFAGGATPLPGETLNLESCVDIALANSPGITAALGSVSAAEASLAEARVDMTEAERNRERSAKLFAKGYIAETERDEADTAYETAAAT